MSTARPKLNLAAAARPVDAPAPSFRAPLPAVDQVATRDTARQQGFDRTIEDQYVKVDGRTTRRKGNDAQLNMRVPPALRDRFWAAATELGITSGADMIKHLMKLHDQHVANGGRGEER